MRPLFIALLAFAAGVLVMALVAHPPLHQTLQDVSSLAASASDAAGAEANSEQDLEDPPDLWPDQAPSPEQVMYGQSRLLQQALAELKPRAPGKPNLYFIGFASDGGETVFHNEVEYAARLFAQRFDARGHTLVLENSPLTLQTRPLAMWSNLDAALGAVAKQMDLNQDILLLYIATHGSADHSLLIDMDPLPLDQIEMTDLADILKKYPFRWKVVVLNACYSGGFIPPLASPGTLILTAAASHRSSFGCSSKNHATYFGRAWLIDGLNRQTDLIQGFRYAQDQIAHWEQRDQLPPSLPQIFIGAGIQSQLKRWNQSFTPGPPLPYLPAAASSAR